MGNNTKIEWCDATFNPWWGCTRISPGCDHCYAASLSKRVGFPHLWDGERRTFGEKHWREPLKWNATAEREGTRPRVFCASMADVFDADAPEGERDRLWALIESTPHLDWLLLTKRIGNAGRMLPSAWSDAPLPNVWLGATIVNQEEAERDIPKLLATPASVRFLSCEPLLGPLTLRDGWFFASFPTHVTRDGRAIGASLKIHWVIVGGESGPGARPMNPHWVRYLRHECTDYGVAFFFKQWGEWGPECLCDKKNTCPDVESPAPGFPGVVFRCGKKRTGRLICGRTWDELPRQSGQRQTRPIA